MQDSLLAPRSAWLPAAFAAIGRHRFLTTRQIAAAVGIDAAAVSAALDALVAEHLVVRLHPTRMLDGPDAGPAFALSRRGAAMLAGTTGNAAIVPNTKKSLYMLAHELAVNDLAIVLERLRATGKFKLLRWETAREKIATQGALVDRAGRRRIPLVADALAVVEIGAGATALLIEVDRGTVPVARMKAKYGAYCAWARENGALRKFGIRSLRMLTLAPSPARLARLRDAAIEATDGRGTGLHWVALQRDVAVNAPEKVLAACWCVARRGDETRTLFEPTSTTAADEPAPAHDADPSGVHAGPA